MYTILVLFALCGSIFALTEEEIKTEMTRLVLKCNEKAGIDVMELMELQRYIIPTKTQTKCVLACAYKAAGVMTKDGLYDLDYAYKLAEETKNGDEKRLQNGRKVADICVKVNDVKVSDGTKGCERAVLIFKCTIDTAPKYGFKL